MTEIPEHLLKRSRERRSAIGQGDDAATSDSAPSSSPATTASSAPATTAAAAAPAATGPAPRTAAPAPAAPPPPAPEPVYVQAAKQRKKIPFWAMATLSLMPLWAFMYVRAVTQPPEVVEGPLGTGSEIYSNCASCHGAAGGGGVGYPFEGQSVLQTFPHIEDQIRYVYYGTEGYNAAGVEIYGNPDRPGGPHITGGRGVMPAFGSAADRVRDHRRGLSRALHARRGRSHERGMGRGVRGLVCTERSRLRRGRDRRVRLHQSEAEPIGDVEIIPVGPEAVAGSPAG